MMTTTLKLAVEFAVDLARPVPPSERVNLERALALAKEVSRVRGHTDPAIAVIEGHLLAALPLSEPQSVRSVVLSARAIEEGDEEQAMRQAIADSTSFLAASDKCGLTLRKFRHRMMKYGIPYDHALLRGA